jgi:protoporphyrinogen oxidase
MSDKIIILGAGLAGLSTSYHLGHNRCVILEKQKRAFGHIQTDNIKGFTWDEGPHLSFTKYDYVKELFEKSVQGRFLEYEVETANYYKGHWIPHPAQSNLYAVPEELRKKCLEDFRRQRKKNSETGPENYYQWLEYAFGTTFADTFPSAYTEKYWTVPPERLDIDWVGNRMYYPSVEDVEKGAKGPLPKQTHYIKKIRYPEEGGYQAYGEILKKDANIQYDSNITGISFKEKKLTLNGSETVHFDKLVNTLPLDYLISISDAPAEVKKAAETLLCTSVLLVNVAAEHPTVRPENWFYVYDKDKFSTRINCTEKLSPNNAPKGNTGVQVEVYFSENKPMTHTTEQVAEAVVDELVEMGFVKSKKEVLYVNKKWIKWANVAFDLNRREAHQIILSWLEKHGYKRENDDLEPTTDWNKKFKNIQNSDKSTFWLAGRFGQWKYYWTDDCVLRGKYISEIIDKN